jgi:hypothetical protein
MNEIIAPLVVGGNGNHVNCRGTAFDSRPYFMIAEGRGYAGRHVRQEVKFMLYTPMRLPFDRLKKASAASAMLLVSASAFADAGSAGPFAGMSGHWSGGGTITMSNGASERIRCRAANAVNASGTAIQQTLRCASQSYRLDINSNVSAAGGSLAGNWAEATRGVSGSISGRASSSGMVANVSGAGFAARLDVRTQGDRQSVTIRPQAGTDVAAVSIALRK